MGESRAQRAGLIAGLASLDPQPESVPINELVQVEGTPLEGAPKLDWSEFVRTIACARVTMPRSTVRLSAGRAEMSEAVQALCFLAGANSIFLRRQAPHHRQSGSRARSRSAGKARHAPRLRHSALTISGWTFAARFKVDSPS